MKSKHWQKVKFGQLVNYSTHVTFYFLDPLFSFKTIKNLKGKYI